MDQSFINSIIGICGAAGGWVLKIIWDSINEVKLDLKRMDLKMHEDFVRRDDFKEAVTEIKSDMREGFKGVNNSLNLLFAKLESKEDKDV